VLTQLHPHHQILPNNLSVRIVLQTIEKMSLIPSFFGSRKTNVFDPFSLDIWDPFDGISTSAIANVPSSAARETSQFVNALIDWKETPEAHVFKADLPGLKREEVKVEVEEGRILQISGGRSREKEEKNDKWHRIERISGKFFRRFPLPENIVEESHYKREEYNKTITWLNAGRRGGGGRGGGEEVVRRRRRRRGAGGGEGEGGDGGGEKKADLAVLLVSLSDGGRVWRDGISTSAIANVPSPSARETSQFVNARIDWKETPEAHVFKADLPGLKKEEVKVEVEEGRILQISGERSREKEEKNDKWHRIERSSGKFFRRFQLPENAKMDQVKATMENGVLTVTVPKAEVKKPEVKAIDISG
ncbi:hypothetical protein C3L33_04565, partial [Rhododendron williamsianum]